MRYAFSTTAAYLRDGRFWVAHDAGLLDAETNREALAIAAAVMNARYPAAAGWFNHDAKVSPDLLDPQLAVVPVPRP